VSTPRATPRGFTFVELVLVTVVVGILLAATVPRFQATAQGLRLEHAAFDLLQLLRAARARAVAEGQTISWVWSEAEGRAHLERLAPDGTVSVLTERGARSTAVPQGAVVTVTQEDRAVECACVRYGADGRQVQEIVVAAPTLIEVTLHGTAYHIELHGQTNRAVLSAGPAAR
jgi:prepilin-type N-terminal cleavage/methylation domain-containing protein